MKFYTAVAIAFALVSVAPSHGLEKNLKSCEDVFANSTDASEIMEYAENPACIAYLHELADEGHYVPKDNERVILTSLKLHLPRLERKVDELRVQVSNLDQKLKKISSASWLDSFISSDNAEEIKKQRDELRKELDHTVDLRDKVDDILQHYEHREAIKSKGKTEAVELDGVEYVPYTKRSTVRKTGSVDGSRVPGPTSAKTRPTAATSKTASFKPGRNPFAVKTNSQRVQ